MAKTQTQIEERSRVTNEIGYLWSAFEGFLGMFNQEIAREVYLRFWADSKIVKVGA